MAHAKYQLLIGGKLTPAASALTEKIISPASEEVIGEVPAAGEEDVDLAVIAAASAFEKWAQTTPKERARVLLQLADLVDAHADELAKIESENVGKPIALAKSEIPFISDNLRFFAGAARCMEGRAAGEYAAGRTSWLRRDPVGVVASIAPWNYPLMMAIWKLGPAIASGNTVVLKPSEQTPLTTLRLAELAAEVFPPGVFNVITGHGLPVGAALAKHPRVDMVSLTGDVSTGKEVARAAASSVKRVHLELGGKAPVIVFDDADLSLLVATVRYAGFVNSGQDCTAACRIYARDRIYDKVLADLVPAVQSIKVGEIGAAETEMGSLISSAHADRVAGFVDRAASTKNVEVLLGGKRRESRGFWYEPTVIAGAKHGEEIVKREIFGPVVTVTRFSSDEEAIAWANDVDYGLSASVWTTSMSRALEASRRLKFGTVWINDHCTLVSEMPHGGFKQSGYGSDMSMYSLDDYTQVKHVMARIG
jgi:aminobutyraldehyde dehydrogenase